MQLSNPYRLSTIQPSVFSYPSQESFHNEFAGIVTEEDFGMNGARQSCPKTLKEKQASRRRSYGKMLLNGIN